MMQIRSGFAMFFLGLCLAGPALSGPSVAHAQVADEPAESAPVDSAEAANAAPRSDTAAPRKSAQEAFDVKFDQWKSLLKSLREIRAEFLIAPEDQLETLQSKFEAKIVEGRELEQQLYEAAAAAFAESPNEDRELTQFLISVAQDQVSRDDYFAAMKVLTPLLEANAQEALLLDLAGRAAFGTNQFDKAEALLKDAASADSISSEGQQYLDTIDKVKTTWEEEAKLREAETLADDLPRVRLRTSEGDIVLELFENEAPETVGNFISLVEKGFYDQLTFHRVIKGFMAQAGCPEDDGTGSPGYSIYCECVNDDHRKHFAGSLSMAKSSARNTGGSQFFITFVPTAFLNGQHTVFGRVIEGWDVLPRIVRREPGEKADGKSPLPPTTIEKAEVIRKRDHDYRPNKVN